MVNDVRVMLDRDLASLYGVTTAALNQAVARNISRFPVDFAFVVDHAKLANLISQSVISSSHGGRRKPTRVFTELGVAMLSSVLKSQRAIKVNIAIMRAFVRLRELVSTHRDLAARIDELEEKYDGKFAIVFDAMRKLLEGDIARRGRPRIGFTLQQDRRALPPRSLSKLRSRQVP